MTPRKERTNSRYQRVKSPNTDTIGDGIKELRNEAERKENRGIKERKRGEEGRQEWKEKGRWKEGLEGKLEGWKGNKGG